MKRRVTPSARKGPTVRFLSFLIEMVISNIVLFLLSHSAAMLGREDPGDDLSGHFENVPIMEGEC